MTLDDYIFSMDRDDVLGQYNAFINADLEDIIIEEMLSISLFDDEILSKLFSSGKGEKFIEKMRDDYPDADFSYFMINYVLEYLPGTGIEVDINELVSKLPVYIEYEDLSIVNVLPRLIETGYAVDLEELIPQLSINTICYYCDRLLDLGVKPSTIAANIPPEEFAPHGYCYRELLNTGDDLRYVIATMSDEEIVEYLDEIRQSGRDPIDALGARQVAFNYKQLKELGLEIDRADLESRLLPDTHIRD